MEAYSSSSSSAGPGDKQTKRSFGIFNPKTNFRVFKFQSKHQNPKISELILETHLKSLNPPKSSGPTLSSSSSLMNPQESKKPNQPSLLYSSLQYSVRKPSGKQWKKPIAPLPPTPTRVYKVDPVNFRDIVQKLTGAPEFQQSRRLQSVAPPPLNLATPSSASDNVSAPLQLLSSPEKTPLSAFYRELMAETLDTNPRKSAESLMASNSLGMGLSPSSYTWCYNFPILSPGTLSSIEQSTI